MPLFRKSLNWIAIAILAIFAPLVAVAIFAIEKVRTGRRARRPVVSWNGDTVVALTPRLRQRRDVRPSGDGAVILAFRRRSPVGMATDDPQAAAGSR